MELDLKTATRAEMEQYAATYLCGWKEIDEAVVSMLRIQEKLKKEAPDDTK